MRFQIGDEVIERICGCNRERRIMASRNNGAEVGVNGGATTRWYDSLTGRRVPANEGAYRAIHSLRYKGRR